MHTRYAGFALLLFLAVIAPIQADDLFQERTLTTVPDSYGNLVADSAKVLADGQTFGYLVEKGAKLALFHTGKEVTELDRDPQGGVFRGPGLLKNPGGGILYFGKRNGKCVLVLSDVVWETPCMASVARYVISPEGKHLAYWVRTDPKKQLYSVFIDGKECGPFFGVGTVVFGEDGSFELRARRGAEFPKGTMVLITSSGQETPLSAAAVAAADKTPAPGQSKTRLVGHPLPNTAVSANGATTARFWNDERYETVFTTTGTTVSIKGHLVVNGATRTVEGRIKEIVVSPDGGSVACVVESWGQDQSEQRPHVEGYAVLRGEEMGERFPSEHHPPALGMGADYPPMIKSLTFSPNGKSLAYFVDLRRTGNGKQVVVLNGVKSEPVDEVLSPLIFNADGSKLAYGALAGRQILWKVMAAGSGAAAMIRDVREDRLAAHRGQ